MKRLLAALLSLLLCFSLAGCSLILDFSAEPPTTTIPEDDYPYVADEASYGYYYDQLSDDSKAVYRAILKNKDNTEGTEIILPKTLILSFAKDSGDEEFKATVSETVLAITQPAIDALLYDNPEFFYVSMGGENSSTFSVPHRKQESTDGMTVYLRKLVFMMHTENLGEDESLAEGIEALQTAINHFPITGESRYERLLSIHEQLSAAVTYDSSGCRPHCSAGALVDGRAVCDGYAKAFKLLCDREGIPCVIVAGVAKQNGRSEPHAWNYVQMEDGLWYGVDTTWDDVGPIATKHYFLVGAEESSFLDSHVPSGKFSEGDHTPFTLPTLSPYDYEPT